jgi:hypothetical protein
LAELLLLQVVVLGRLRLLPLGQILTLKKPLQAEPHRQLADLTGTFIFNTFNLWPTT